MPIKDLESKRAYQRAWYRANSDKVIAKVARQRRNRKDFFRKFKETLTCIKCGETHPATLDFHHRDPAAKFDEVTNMVQNGCSKQRVLEEIAKCDILCANCHRKEHWT